jgi:hypothetical protein
LLNARGCAWQVKELIATDLEMLDELLAHAKQLAEPVKDRQVGPRPQHINT